MGVSKRGRCWAVELDLELMGFELMIDRGAILFFFKLVKYEMGVSKNNGNYPQIIQFNRDFPYKSSILGCFPIFGNTQIYHPPMDASWR